MTPGPWELLIILAIVLLIFGPRRLKSLGSDLGNAIKGFRSAMSEKEDPSQPAEDPRIIPNEGNSSDSVDSTTEQETTKQKQDV